MNFLSGRFQALETDRLKVRRLVGKKCSDCSVVSTSCTGANERARNDHEMSHGGQGARSRPESCHVRVVKTVSETSRNIPTDLLDTVRRILLSNLPHLDTVRTPGSLRKPNLYVPVRNKSVVVS